MTNENILRDACLTLFDVWLHRNGNEAHAAVVDTINALYKDLKPQIHKKIRINETTIKLLICLPAGLSYSEFKQKENYFKDASGGEVQIEKQGKIISMIVMTDELKKKYPYLWEYGKYPDMYLPVPFGYSAMGFIVRDISNAPNILVAGHPGSGKSMFLHNVAVSLLLARELNLVIIDLKKLEFSYLKQKALVITDLNNARILLKSLNTELDKRLEMLEILNAVKLQDFPINELPFKFIVVIIDELAELQDDGCQTALNRIVRLGRAAGICVIASTQRPSSTIFKKFGDSKAMFSCNICYKVRDSTNSRMILDNDRAANLPEISGRAIYQWEKELEIQSMYLKIPSQAKKLIENVDGGILHVDATSKRLPPR